MRSRWFGLVIAALALALSVWAYARLPESIATQWDAQGVPNGYSPRLWVVAMLPLVILVVTGLFNVTPVIDPRRENYPKFWDTYWLIANAILAFVGVAHVLVIAHGMGYTVPPAALGARPPVGLPRQLSDAGPAELVCGGPDAVDPVQRHRVAEDAPHGGVAARRRWARHRCGRLHAGDDVRSHHGGDGRRRDAGPRRAVVRPVEAGTEVIQSIARSSAPFK